MGDLIWAIPEATVTIVRISFLTATDSHGDDAGVSRRASSRASVGKLPPVRVTALLAVCALSARAHGGRNLAEGPARRPALSCADF